MLRRCLGITVSLIFLSIGLAFAQEQAKAEPEVEWCYGEVVGIDVQNNQIMLKYFDYEIEQDKEMIVNVDEKTVYENVKSLAEIKPNDALSIDYIVNTAGKNLAGNISVEKAEAVAAPAPENTPAVTTETKPQDLEQPPAATTE